MSAGSGNIADDSIRWTARVKFPDSAALSGMVYIQEVGEQSETIKGTRSRPTYRIDLARSNSTGDGFAVVTSAIWYIDIGQEDNSRSRRLPQAFASTIVDTAIFHDLELILEASHVKCVPL